MQIFKILSVFIVVFAIVLLASPSFAADQMDLSVGLKTLPLLTNKMSSTVVMAVVYNPANSESRAEAESIKGLIDAGMQAPGGVALKALMVPTSDLSKLPTTKIAFVTRAACTEEVGLAAAANGILTMSTDLDCVKAGRCIIGIVSRPNVDVYYSKSAADAAKVGFSQVFSMLAKQV